MKKMAKKALLVYDTNLGYTEQMAKLIEAAMKADGIDVVTKFATKAEPDDLAGVDAVVLGCPTYFEDVSTKIKLFMIEMKKANLKGKIGAAFGSYGWGGESIQIMNDTMKRMIGMVMVEPGLKVKTSQMMVGEGDPLCTAFGKKIAEKMLST
ncbi:MAG TPA: FprA family A-type flavoprotein [Methanomicrobia archaeon]|nr:FprA family A-type flavoprotein [Methanomicrobia archaeon]